MKKIVLAIAATLTMSMSAMAQDAEQGRNGERRQFDRTEMIQNRTNETAKKYGLNEEQSAKLLELNTKYADKIGPRGGGQRGGMRRGGPAARGERPQRQPADSLQRQGGRRGNFGGNPDEMRKNFEAYNEELKAILTPEQFEAYQADQKQQMERRGQRNGQRPQRKNNDNN